MAQNNPVYLEFACESNKEEKNSTRSVMYLPKQTYEACALHTEFDFFFIVYKVVEGKMIISKCVVITKRKTLGTRIALF